MTRFAEGRCPGEQAALFATTKNILSSLDVAITSGVL